MVISLSSDKAFKYFKERGFVVSARTSRRKRPFFKTWLNRGRGKSKVCNVAVCEIKEINWSNIIDKIDMSNLAAFSGFYHLSEWKKEILELNDLKEMPERFYLYLIKKRD